MRVLAIDQARKSGWAVVEPGVVLAHGLAETALERRAAVARGVALEVDYAVLEQHSRAAFRTSSAHKLAMGEARGWWTQELEAQGVARTKVRLMHVSTWRGVLFGRSNWKRDKVKAECRALSHLAFGLRVDEDVAEAICIGLAALSVPSLRAVAAMR